MTADVIIEPARPVGWIARLAGAQVRLNDVAKRRFERDTVYRDTIRRLLLGQAGDRP